MRETEPGFVQLTLVPLKLSPGKATSEWVTLDGFRMERQCHTKWCWAAVGEAVARFYGIGGGHAQRDLAKIEMPQFDYREACYVVGQENSDELLPYNIPRVLMSVLLGVGCYDHGYDPDVPAPLGDVQAWLDGDRAGRRAVCVRIKWPNGDAHFVTIDGYRRGTNWLHVWDPASGDGKEIRYEELASSYRDIGRWVDTIYTKRAVP
jgi:hypothetical protein